MARLFDDASSEYLTVVSNLGITAYPVTIVGFAATDESDNQAIGCFGDTDVEDYHTLRLRDPADTDVIAHVKIGAANDFAASASSYPTDSSWFHAAAVFAGNSSRYAYLNGTPGTESTSASLWSANVDNFSISAAVADSTIIFYFSGSIAEVAVWNTNLSTPEIAALSKGYSPLFIRPQNLVAYWPLLDNDNDRVGGYHMTPVNTPSWSAHPPVIMPAPVIYSFPSVAAGGWAHKFCGVTSPGKVLGVANASIGKINGVAI